MSTALVSGLAQVFLSNTSAAKAAGAISDFSATSLVEFSGAARVEPIAAIDTTLVPYDVTTDVLKLLNSLFSAYYISAGSMATDVGRVKTVQLLDKLNPSRSVGFNLANSILLNSGSVSGESLDAVNLADGSADADPIEATDLVPTKLPVYSETEGVFSSEDAKIDGARGAVDLATVANLSVGQMVTLTVADGGEKRDIQVQIRLISYPTRPDTLISIMKWSERNNSLKARISAWRAGELSGWRDLVLMRDIYAERKRALMDDKTGLFQAMTSRVNKNILAGLVSMTPSVGTISSILVVSTDTVKKLEGQIDGKLSSFKVRQRMMNATGVMLLAVVDPILELVTIYTYSIALPSEYSIKQIKSAGKGNGPDIGEIIKLMNAGAPHTF